MQEHRLFAQPELSILTCHERIVDLLVSEVLLRESVDHSSVGFDFAHGDVKMDNLDTPPLPVCTPQ